MGLGKGVAGKGLYLAPYLFRNLFGIPFVTAVAEEALSDLLHLLSRPVLAAHGASQRVSIGEVKAGEVMTYLQHIFLVDHHPEGLTEKILHHRMDILKLVRMVKTEDELSHHT